MYGRSSFGNLTIPDSTVSASSSSYGSGVGRGYEYLGESLVDNLIIFDSVVTVLASHGSGIGTGTAFAGISRVAALTLTNVTVDARSPTNGMGIGGGTPGGELEILTLSGLCVFNSNSKSATFSTNATSIVIADVPLVFETEGTRLFESSPSGTGLIDLAMFYHKIIANGQKPSAEFERKQVIVSD
jgi:hypothetical protein